MGMQLIPKNFYLDDFFDDFLTSRDNHRFKCDIYEKDNKYYIDMDAPGFSKENLTIEVDKGYLMVKLSKTNEEEDEKKNYIRRERTITEYQRSFYVGDIDDEKISASFKNGTINIVIPKNEIIETKKIINIE